MSRHVDVAIIGAGSAGLFALSQVKQSGKSFVLIDGGELGTTCARVGCMPSKALIQVAEDFHRRTIFKREGIKGGEGLSVNSEDAVEHVQDMRDTFVDRVLSNSIDNMGEEFISENAHFISEGVLDVGGEKIQVNSVILATGSSPIIPKEWQAFGDSILTTDDFFELESLPDSMAVIGLGVIGLELGQALHRLGVDVIGIDQMETIANVSDPEISKMATEIFNREMTLWLGDPVTVEQLESGKLSLSCGDKTAEVEKILVSIGRRPNLAALQLENAGIPVNVNGVPEYDPTTMKISGHSVYLAGDVNADRPILHEASDEGTIAGFNAIADQPQRFRRKTPFAITFSDPNIALIGQSFDQLDAQETAIASITMAPVGRALILGKNRGLIRLYAEKKSGKLIGAALLAVHAEHLGHLLAWSIEQQMTVLQMLEMPFYHPVIEEALQPVLRDLVKACDLTIDRPVGLRFLGT